MLAEKVGNFYSALEEKYYSLLDFLDEKGLPVYAYNDFLEEKGLPAFPVTVALMVLLLAVLYGLFFVGSTVNPEISFEFQDQFDESVSGVTVTVKDVSGNTIKSPEKLSNGESLFLSGIPIGAEIVLVAEKEGFEKSETELKVSREKITTTVSLERKISSIAAEMQLVDVDTGDPVRGAMVTAEWRTITKTEYSDAAGKVSFAGIPSNADVLITINADGYEKLTDNYTFTEGELKEVSLVGNTASLAGTTRLVITVSDEDGSRVGGAKIILTDRETDTSIEERTLEESEALFSIPKGTSIRLVVQKEGFLTYDSLDSQESRTMRQDEEQWDVTLEKGGTRLVLTVFAGQTPLSDATVQLFDMNNNRLDYGITGFGGTTEFTGLSPEEHYVTAYKQGYLPSRKKVNVAGTESDSIALESADNSNSSYVGISVLDSFKAMANNADLFFLEKSNGETLPLGIPPLQTDVSGYASIVAKTGTVVVVKAQKDMQTGFGEKLVEANKDNQLVIELSKPVDVVELLFLDSEGNPVDGIATIETVTGELLYEGEIIDGKVFVDTEGNSDIVVNVETTEGQTFSQQVSVEGQESVQITLGEETTGVAPTITFTGIFDEHGEPAEGITPGKDYAIGFQASWPTGAEKGGVHVRLGEDGVAFVDSQEAGIVGYDAATPSYLYGKSYQPLPAPGNETADRQNVGTPGELNKFLELYFDQPENMIDFRVRVRARDSIQAEKIEVNYRAWTEAGGKYFRVPADAELGENAFSSTKTALYAVTEKAMVNVYASDATCEEELCANYFFVMPNGLYVDTQEFSAAVEETYALEIDLSSKEPVSLTLKLDTDKASPKISFTGYEVDNFVDQETQDALPADTSLSGQGYLDWPAGSEELQSTDNPLGFKSSGGNTSLTVTALGVSPERSRKVRVYFKGTAEGVAEILLQAVGQSVINEKFSFNVEKDSEMQVSLTPRDVKVGEPFTVKAINAETGEAIQDATAQIRNSEGEIVEAVAGRGSSRAGLRGEYYFKNSLDPGTYTIRVTANNYKTEELELVIARDGILTVKSPVTIDITKETGEKTVSLGIGNSGEEEVQQMSYEIEKDAGFPDEFMVSATLPPVIAGSQDGTATIRVTVNLDEDSEENLYGEADLTIKGMVSGNYPTSTTTRLKISYNKELDEACLYFDEEKINVKLIGRAGSTVTEEIEVENKCGIALNLKAKIEEEQEDPNLSVSVSPLSIDKDEIEKVKITITNSIERLYDLQSRRDYKITFESSQIAKTIDLSVELWNPRTNLSYPPSVSLWMVRNAAEELAYSQAPIQIMNNGAMPVTAFRAAVTPEAYMQGISVGIKPDDISAITLYPGMPLTPQRFVYAQTSQTEALQRPGQGWITFTGVVEGRMYPDLGRTSLSVNYSGTKCLKVSAVDSMVFSSKESGQGTLERAIKIRNECGEQVRLSGTVKPQQVSGNTFALNPAMTLNPGQEQTVKLILLKGQEANKGATLKVIGLLVNQGKWIESNELQVTLKLGELAATTEGKATQKISIKVCDSDDETRQIAFPIISSDCGNGYCDAKQLGEYLTQKANTLVKMAEDKIKRAKNNAENFGSCAGKEYCSFDEMGILTDQFPVYQQLDFMTAEVLEKALKEKGNSELKTYAVFQGAKRAEDIGSIGFDVGKAYLGGNFKGCGKYYVQIIGAARVINGEIPLESGERNFMISINIEQGPAVTEECLHRIENVANFLPVDEGFTMLQNYHAWPGLVKSGTETNKLAEAFAKELFGKAEGRFGASVSATSNRLEIVKGDTGGGLVKIRIAKEGKANEPKAVYAHVPSNYTEANDQMASEIAKAFKSFENHSFSEEDCWGEDASGQYVIMKSQSDHEKLYGKLEIAGPGKIRISGEEQCIDLNVTSKTDEKVWFGTNFLSEGQNPVKTGIEYIEIRDKKDETLLKEKANGTSGMEEKHSKKEVTLQKVPTTSVEQTYKAEIKFCIKGTNEFPIAVDNIKSISITGHGSAAGGRLTDPPHEVGIEACGMHPYDLVKKMGQVQLADIEKEDDKKIVAYATVNWKDGPMSVDLRSIQRSIAAEAAMDEAKKKYGTGEDVPAMEQPAYIEELANRKLMATWVGYALPCSIMSIFLNWWNGATKAAAYDIPFTCVGPAAWATKDIIKEKGGTGEEIADTIDAGVRAIFKVIPLVGDWLADQVVPKEGEFSSTPSKEEAIEGSEGWNGFKENLLGPAVTGLSTRALLSTISNGAEVITATSAKMASEEAADKIMQNMIKQNMQGMSDNAIESLIGGKYVNGKFTPFAAGTPSERLRNLLSAKIESKLMLNEGKMQVAEALANQDLKIVSSSVTETSETMSTYVASHLDDFGDKAIGKLGKANQDDFLRELLDPVKVETPSVESSFTMSTKPYEAGQSSRIPGVTGKKTAVVNSWKRKTLDQIEMQLNATEDGRKLLADTSFWDPSGTSPNSVQKLVQTQAADLTDPSSGIFQQVSKTPRQIAAEVPDVIDPRTGRVIRPGTPAKYVDEVLYAIDADALAGSTRRVAIEAQKKAAAAYTTGVIGKSNSGKLIESLIGGDESKGIANATDDVVGTIRPSATSGATRASRFKDSIKRFFSKRFWNWSNIGNIVKNLGKGVGMGVIEAGAGYLGWEEYWDEFGNAPVAGAETAKITPATQCLDRDNDGRCNEDPINGIDDDKDGLIDEDYPLLNEQELKKGRTYRIEITGDAYGKIYDFSLVEGKEAYAKMDKELAAGEAQLWEEKGCNNFRNKTVDKYLGNLAPVPLKGIQSEQVIAYYNHNSLFADAVIGNGAPGARLPEEQLVSILFTEPERIPECKIPNQWYKRAQGQSLENARLEADKAIKCAAEQLRIAAGKVGLSSPFKAIATTLAKGTKDVESYANKVSETERKWKTFRIVR